MSEAMERKNIIYALDIGTRSVIGIVGRAAGGRFQVLAVEREEHSRRAMQDGQIEDIAQVAGAARAVTGRLEEKVGCTLDTVCVAAAGRALRTERGRFTLTLEAVQRVTDELVSRLEAGAVSEAEKALLDAEEQRFYLVGYTVCQYRLDHYPLSTLRDHNGRELEVEIVATFLPSEVVESLYTAMREAGLEVASLTLEPIAALNAAIPQELRLLNLVLADVGAGTTDIAVCRDGSVVGYTMSTVAGDEITEAVMQSQLVDFKTAERLKASLAAEEPVRFRDILGQEHVLDMDALYAAVEPAARLLAQELARQVTAINGAAPSALFLAGGGSRLRGLRELAAEYMGMPENRVAIAGNNFEMSAFSEEIDLNDPEYATPLGIAVSAGLGLVNDSYRVSLNGQPAKLFRSGSLTALDILMMNGYHYADLIGRAGANVTLTVNGQRRVFRGSPAEPAVLRVNGADVPPSQVIRAGDSIEFTPARSGGPCVERVSDLELPEGRVWVNGGEAGPETALHTGDSVEYEPAPPPPPPEPVPAPRRIEPGTEEDAPPPVTPEPEAGAGAQPERARSFLLNGRPLALPPKEDGTPYYLMDLLVHSGIDFDHLDRPVLLRVNGAEGFFTQVLLDGDAVVIAVDPPEERREEA